MVDSNENYYAQKLEQDMSLQVEPTFSLVEARNILNLDEDVSDVVLKNMTLSIEAICMGIIEDNKF